MQSNPLVSIIIPCYNQALYLPEALESVMNQTYLNWECIMVNDGSPDNTEEIAKEWLIKDTRYRYIYKENSGVCDTRNKGIEEAKGEFILPLDADDKIAPQYIAEAIHTFLKDQDTKLVYCNKIYFGAINKQEPCPPYSFETMLSENQIHHAAMYKKSDFEKTRGYNLNMHDGLEDWDFWLELLNHDDKVVKLNGYYYYYRIKKVSRSTEIDFEKNERLILQIFKNHQDKYLQFFNPVRDRINHLHYKLESARLQKSTEYTIGKVICFPFRLIGKVWQKLRS